MSYQALVASWHEERSRLVSLQDKVKLGLIFVSDKSPSWLDRDIHGQIVCLQKAINSLDMAINTSMLEELNVGDAEL